MGLTQTTTGTGETTLPNQPGGHKATGLGVQGGNLMLLPHAIPLIPDDTAR